MKNAFLGYSYQKLVTSLMLAKMDVERDVDGIEIEAPVDHKFDDLHISCGGDEYFVQIKDFEDVHLDDLYFTGENIVIAEKPHRLSSKINVLFFKSIAITPDTSVFGIPAYRFGSTYLISQSRYQIERLIEELYKTDHLRKYTIDRFFSDCLDRRQWLIKKFDLPVLNIFKTNLVEPTVDVAVKILHTTNILHIEGKPGVGKSHLVVCLEKQYRKHILYRFWVSNQDADYRERLKYSSFIKDFTKKLFRNLKSYTEEEIVEEITKQDKTVIIDGLDHVENYNVDDLHAFVGFIEKLAVSCKVVVLSRPLMIKTSWQKQLLGNWNRDQTKTVLKELYHIKEYTDIQKIFSITDGYPILVRYVAEHQKLTGTIPDFETFDTVDKYYETIMGRQKGRQAMSLFLCIRSYVMQSEIDTFLDQYEAAFVREFISEHPYLFELRLNRVSLFHDSFITYLRNTGIGFDCIHFKVTKIVYDSILAGERRFLSRFECLGFSIEEKKNIVKKYASLLVFRELVKGVVDFEAIRDFYEQLREALASLSPEDLTVSEYYNLASILNIVVRDHLSSLNGFYYTYVQTLLFNGYNVEDVTSNRYLFGMFYYVETNDGSLILNSTSQDHYDTSRFYSTLQNDVMEEDDFFSKHSEPLATKRIDELLEDKKNLHFRERMIYVLEDLFIYTTYRKKYKKLYQGIRYYMEGKDWKATSILEDYFYDQGIELRVSWILQNARDNLLALGKFPGKNEYLNTSLREFIYNHRHEGSFSMWVDILNHMRLALHQKRKLDIESISMFWTKYYQRKDYTLRSIDMALPIFEKLGYVSPFESISLITKIQGMSEKGYRGLLASYLMQHQPQFTLTVLEQYNPSDLHISWFDLTPEYLNVLPDRIYNIEARQVFNCHRSSRSIDYRDVKNLIGSKWLGKFKEDLSFYRLRVLISSKDKNVKKLKELGVPYTYSKEKHYKPESQKELLAKGILMEPTASALKSMKLKSYEIAAFSDGYYAALSDVEIYRVFGKLDIQRNIQKIVHNAMTSRLRSIDSFHTIWALPGNLVKLFYDNDVDTDYSRLFKDFLIYLNLSMFEFDHT